MLKCLITRPNHDKVTNYLFYWSREILNEPYSSDIQFLDLAGEKANKEEVVSYLKKQNPRVVLFNGHGSSTEIFGFKNELIIEIKNNEHLLKGKIVYSLSCSSARKLGESAVNNGTESFIGYKNPFVIFTHSEREATPLKDHIASSFLQPSNKLSISLLKGNSAQESSVKSKEEFEKEIGRYASSSSIEGSERIIAALLWDMNSQVVLGNKDAKII